MKNIQSQPVAAPRPRILVADDSLVARRMIRFALDGIACDLVEAEDGVAAWEQLQSGEFSLLITDLYMPGMNGIELIRKLRATDRGADIPIILLTTDTCAHQEREAREAGVSLFIRKPFQSEQLAGLVRQAVN